MTPPQQGWRRPSLLGSSRDGDGHLCTPFSRDGDGHLCPPPGVLKVFSAFSAPPLQWRPSSRLYPPAVAAFQLPCPPPQWRPSGFPALLKEWRTPPRTDSRLRHLCVFVGSKVAMGSRATYRSGSSGSYPVQSGLPFIIGALK